MLTRLAIRIQECFDALTPSEQTLASFILAHQHLVVGLSAAELAREAGTSKSTAARFFRTLGYESFDAVRLQARSELNRQQPGAEWADSERPAPMAGSPEAYLAQEMTRLARTLEGFSSETLKVIVERLAAAERVWIAAFEDDAPLAPLALSFLSAIRAGVYLLADGTIPIHNRLLSLGPRDAVLMIALGRRSKEARFVIAQTESAGSSLLLLTDLRQAGPAQSHAVVRCHVANGQAEGSVTACVSVLQFIARQLATRLGDRATSRLSLIETLKSEARNQS